MADKANKAPESRLSILPDDVKLKILESVPGVNIAFLGSFFPGLGRLCLDNKLWKKKYAEEFGDGDAVGSSAAADDGREVNWRIKFYVSWIDRKDRRKAQMEESERKRIEGLKIKAQMEEWERERIEALKRKELSNQRLSPPDWPQGLLVPPPPGTIICPCYRPHLLPGEEPPKCPSRGKQTRIPILSPPVRRQELLYPPLPAGFTCPCYPPPPPPPPFILPRIEPPKCPFHGEITPSSRRRVLEAPVPCFIYHSDPKGRCHIPQV